MDSHTSFEEMIFLDCSMTKAMERLEDESGERDERMRRAVADIHIKSLGPNV